jgi:hypothetical protein
MGCYVLLVITIVFLRWHLTRQNKKKDDILTAAGLPALDAGMLHAFEDLTDRENQNFRYIY